MTPALPHDEWHFDTEHVGRRVVVFDELDSTNTFAAALDGPDAVGTVVVARNQTAGRGRFGRTWRSRPGSSLLMSVVLAPPPELRRPVVLTAWAAVAVAGAVRKLAGVDPRIKWPNDLLVGGKKVCGILIEQGVGTDSAGEPRFRTILGVGLNLNQTAAEFAAAGLPDATSLSQLADREYDLRSAVAAVVRRLDATYSLLLGAERWTVEAEWKRQTGLVGGAVVVTFTDGTSRSGKLRDMRFDGVDLELADGTTHTITPETVEHVRAGE